MKITANRRDDVLKRKAAYDAEMDAYNTRYDDASRRFRKAEKETLAPIQNFLEDELSRFDVLQFDVRVERAWNWKGQDGADVYVQCNERNHFDENSALSWHYRAKLEYDTETGETYVVRQSGSCSGLKATTPAQMKSLRQTVDAFEFLNSVDWDHIVDVTMPEWDDFSQDVGRQPARQNFSDELAAATLADLVGTDTWIKIANWGESCPYNDRYVWIQPIRESGSQFTCEIISDWSIQYYQNYTADPDRYQDDVYRNHNYDSSWVYRTCSERRIRKSSIHIIEPEQTLDIPRA